MDFCKKTLWEVKVVELGKVTNFLCCSKAKVHFYIQKKQGLFCHFLAFVFLIGRVDGGSRLQPTFNSFFDYCQ